jgi:hypothetical protein
VRDHELRMFLVLIAFSRVRFLTNDYVGRQIPVAPMV